MPKYRAAVVGCGGRAPDHIDAYASIENAEVVACCAPSGTRRDPLAERYGIAPYADAGEMIRRELPDMVHLVTWPDTRVELMTLVSECGVAMCTTEKPVATNVRDWRTLVELEARSETKFAVCHQFRWHPNLVKCQEAMSSGKLGKPLFVDMSAGMNIAGQGTHSLNYGFSVIGDPLVTQVYGNASGWDDADPGHPAPLSTEAYLTFDNGARGVWTSGPVSPRCGGPDVVWQHKRVAAHAERGRVLWEQFAGWEIAGPEGCEGADQSGAEAVQKNHLAAQAGFHAAMFAWHEGEACAPGTNLKRSLHEAAVILALYQSALERRPVDMDGFDPPDRLFDAVKNLLSGGKGVAT